MNEKYKLVMETLGKKDLTANEIIETIWDNDMKKDIERPRKWLFYTHLNKIFAPLERSGNIKCVGHKVGPTNRTEKIWMAR